MLGMNNFKILSENSKNFKDSEMTSELIINDLKIGKI